MSEDKQIIEINGIKMEIDLRHAKRIHHFRVGDAVKLLMSDGSNNTVHAGVIVGFEQFEKLPTIVVVYLDTSYYSGGLKTVFINEKSKDKYEIIPCSDDSMVKLDKEEVIRKFNKDIEEAEITLATKIAQKKYFEERFGVYFDKD